MLFNLMYFVFALALVLLWAEGARARELAVYHARKACRKAGHQFLDDSVYRSWISPRWTHKGLRFQRRFEFEYSIDRNLREQGFVLMLGNQLEAVHISTQLTIEQDPDTAI